MCASSDDRETSDADDRSPIAKGFALASSVLANAIFVALAVGAGYALDVAYEQIRPWGMVVCALIGVAFFTVGVVSTVKRFEER